MLGSANGFRKNGGVAQLGEHLPCKQGVSGSIPLVSTKFYNTDFREIGSPFCFVLLLKISFIFIETVCVIKYTCIQLNLILYAIRLSVKILNIFCFLKIM